MPLEFGAPATPPPQPGGEIHARIVDLQWLARMRWGAAGFLVLATLVAHQLGMVQRPAPLVAIALLVLTANVVWLHLLQRAAQWPAVAVDRFALLHLAIDELLLAATLHYAGGVDNPFDSLFAFQAAMAAILLPPTVAWTAAGLACLLHTALVLGPQLGLLTEHPVDLHLLGDHVSHEGQSIPHSIVYLLAHWMMLAGVVYFTGTVRIRQHREEQLRLHQQQLARHHERLARVGAISSGVAHSVRNPLHGALNCLDLLERDGEMAEPERRELRGLMREALTRIDRVTQRLLTLTRTQTADRSPVNLSELLADVVRSAEPRAQARHVQLSSRIAGSEAAKLEISLNSQRIGEALGSLVDNAIDASPAGESVQVALSLSQADRAAWIEVRDRGPGVPSEVAAHIFEPFFTTKAVGEGTGIGLAIARRAARDHCGDVLLAETSPQGSVFRFTLPVQAQLGPRLDSLD